MKKVKSESGVKCRLVAKQRSFAIKQAVRQYLDENLTDDELLQVYEAMGGSLRMALKKALDEHRLIEILTALAAAGLEGKGRDLARIVDITAAT